jgi:iron complex outermembrane receptor protein/vitamin B12 transporter
MFLSALASSWSRRALSLISSLLLFIFAAALHAASVRGVVTDATGARVTGAKVSLVLNGKVVATGVSASDGSFQLTTGNQGHMFLLITAGGFRQISTPDFYAGAFDSLERNLVLEPEWAHESIVVTATGTPTPQPETSASINVLDSTVLASTLDLTAPLRTIPGVSLVQTGQRGAQSSLFVRGGDSTGNKVLLDGIDVGDLGSQFDFGSLANNSLQSVEVYRGPNSNLFGAGAVTSVLNMTTEHGTTNFPSVILVADGGNLTTGRGLLTVAGTHRKFDYLGSYGWLQSDNDLPRDSQHLGTAVANIGWQPTASTVLRGTVHYNVAGTGVPKAWDFYHVADDATQKDQNLFISASVSNQTTVNLHNEVRYGATRKREEDSLWSLEGTPQVFNYYCFSAATIGQTVTITGANGYSASGQATLDCSTYAVQLVSNRDQLFYNGNLQITPHLAAMAGFSYQDERGSEPLSRAYYPDVERTNYEYLAGIHGDYAHRFFYTLGGSLEHNSLFGVETTPRAGFSWYALKPANKVFSGTRILFNYGDAIREPKLTDQDYSLYTTLQNAGLQSTIAQMNITPLAAPRARTYEGGVAQSFLSDHIVFRATYFHNQFNREIEEVGLGLLSEVLPGLSSAQKTQLITLLTANNVYGLEINSQAFRSQGAEASVEAGIGKNLFFRGGYTYLDAVVERSFDSDNASLIGGYAPTYNGIPIGVSSPLVGARPFRRPPHTGYFTATYSARKLTGIFSSAFASRSDDSTYLGYQDSNGGNSLLLPNRDLDHGFARLDIGGSYQLYSWLSLTTQLENLLDQQHISPIGYPSLPFTVRSGIRIQWGPGSGR